MTLEIIKPKAPILETDNNVVQAGIDALASGMTLGTVLNLPSAVECVNVALNKKFNGAVVRPYFKALLTQLKALDEEADRLAGTGLNISQVAAGLSEFVGNFSLAHLQQMKIEVYGSVDLWLAAMVASEV